MIIDLDRMRYKVRKAVGIIDAADPDLPQADIDEYLNLALWEVEDKLPFRAKEVRATFVTVAGTRDYTVPAPFESLRELAVVDPVSGQHTPLIQMSAQEYESVYIDDTINTDSQDIPTGYVREADYMTLWPTPDQVYTIWIRRNIILTDLVNSTDVLPIPQVWTEIITLGGIQRAQFDFNSRAASRETKRLQTEMIATTEPVPVKELGDTSLAGIEMFGRDYYQRSPSKNNNNRNEW